MMDNTYADHLHQPDAVWPDSPEEMVSESLRWVLGAYGLGDRSKQVADPDAINLVAEFKRRGWMLHRGPARPLSEFRELEAICRDHAGMRHDAETKLDEIRCMCEDALALGSPVPMVEPAAVLRVIRESARDPFQPAP